MRLAEDEALAAAERLVGSMRSAFDDALVVGWEPLEETFGLPDIDDEHVVAAAVVGGAGAIVTDNLKHFPVENVLNDIQVLSAVEFTSNTADVNLGHAANVISESVGGTGILEDRLACRRRWVGRGTHVGPPSVGLMRMAP